MIDEFLNFDAMDNLILILGLAVVVGTIITNGFIFRKQSRRLKEAEVRIKEAEAKAKEFDALKDTIEQLKKSVDFYDKQFDRMKEMISKKDVAITKLSDEKCEVQKANEKNKRAINKAISCEFVPENEDCPVLAQKKKDEQNNTRKK